MAEIKKRGKGIKKKKVKKKAKPDFPIPNYGMKKRVKKRWRKPRGTGNKKRKKMKHTGAIPKIGYKNPDSVRGLHPTGLEEVLVHNPSEVEAAKGKAIRIASAVGKKKRIEIIQLAKKLEIPVLNEGSL